MEPDKDFSLFFNNLLFMKVFQTFRLAIHPGKMIIAFIAVTIICLAGWIMDISSTVAVTYNRNDAIIKTELDVYIADPGQLDTYMESHERSRDYAGVFSTLWRFMATRFQGAVNSLFAFDVGGVAKNITDCFKAVGWALKYHFFYSLFFFAIEYVVIVIAGGALCRITAVQFAKDEKPGLAEAARFSRKNFRNLLIAPLIPIGVIVFIGLFIFLLGLLGNIPWIGELITALFMPLTLLAGTVISILLIGTVAGFNLMFPAVAYDGSDSFDALSRSYNYVFTKPWRMAFYTTIAAAYGAICYTFVRLLAFLIVSASRLFLQFGLLAESSSEQAEKISVIWPPPTLMDLPGPPTTVATNWSEWFAGAMVQLSVLIIVGLVTSFVISFYFSANTIIYSLMRNRVDGAALEDIYINSEDVENEQPAADPDQSARPPSNTETPDS